ncbi:MAG: cyclic nucleotide-binding/CBS domain-containing protein [Gammaproteobacteria bacterium]|nr:cyclic nucleotide-binding/CBS domain-containing protein [Gammaproteobacteria bacterium]
MEIESLEIFQYLSNCDPISKLEQKIQKQVALNIEIIYVKRDQLILEPGTINEWLYIIRSGAVERTENDGSVVAQFEEKDFFGQASLKREGKVERIIQAIEDTLLYRVPGSIFFQLMESSPYFQFYFDRNKATDRSINFHTDSGQPSALSSTKVSSLLHDKPLMIDHKVSVADCAEKMKDTGHTSVLITHKNEVRGIVTDRVFCTKIVAGNMSHDNPVGLIMSEKLITIDEQATASEALLIMGRQNIRHLPVISQGNVLGVLTATDLIHRQSNNPIYLTNQIHKASNIDKLVEYAGQIPKTLNQLVQNGHNAKDITYSISSIGRAINQRIIKLVEAELGPPPIKYAWIIAGSLARNDQTGLSDQDNAIILSDKYDESIHGDYFQKLSNMVCDGLNTCGYIHCPGDVMASNKKWRQPSMVWRKYFRKWIVTPKPKALMYASIFFDLRCIHGDNNLLVKINQYTFELIAENERFLHFMAANALHNTPPLGLFRNFVLEKHGSEEKALDMKKRGVVPITDLARVYALASGVTQINTQERLQASNKNHALSKSGYMDLSDAFEFLSSVRLNHQSLQISNGKKANNYLPPEELSSLERRHLKDTFEIIRTYQSALSTQYQTASIG